MSNNNKVSSSATPLLFRFSSLIRRDLMFYICHAYYDVWLPLLCCDAVYEPCLTCRHAIISLLTFTPATPMAYQPPPVVSPPGLSWRLRSRLSDILMATVTHDFTPPAENSDNLIAYCRAGRRGRIRRTPPPEGLPVNSCRNQPRYNTTITNHVKNY